MEAANKFGSMKDKVDGLLSTREEAYLGLLEVPDPGEALSSRSPQQENSFQTALHKLQTRVMLFNHCGPAITSCSYCSAWMHKARKQPYQSHNLYLVPSSAQCRTLGAAALVSAGKMSCLG